MKITCLGLAIICTWIMGVAVADDFSGDLSGEIARVQRELRQVQGQRQDLQREVLNDKTEYAAYKKRIKQRRDDVSHATDSVRQRMDHLKTRNDSLVAKLFAVNAAIRQQELQRERFQHILITAVTKLQREVDHFPSLITEQYRGSISYLLGELQAQSVESTEAMYRFVRIVQDMRIVLQDIQVVEGVSPLPELKGTVYRFRIGGVFEAIIDMQGKNAFLWSGNTDEGKPRWQKVADERGSAAIMKAVKIRGGKTIPELVELPFGDVQPDVEGDLVQ